MSAPPVNAPVVRAADGRTLPVTDRLVVGRDETCALSFPTEARLSRRALAVVPTGGGAVLTCLSRTHGLVVDADGALSRLPPASDEGPAGGYVLTRGRATVTGPSWGASAFVVTVTAAAPTGPAVLTMDPTGTATREPVRLRTHTKEFVTALMLCRHRLLDATDLAPPPEVPQLTRAVLEATNSWHLVHALDTDEATRKRLTGRIHEHLKALRVKLVRGGLAERGARLTPSVMVDLLLASGAITRSHLRLLDDEAWLRAQEAQWWDA
ncbi:hypothetical protein [Actinomycetospora corticicola]|uniref:hypothetical protein n=1 Tax=Actinomycetospora corticicola TaxID=663602 RepID=UPI001C5435C0|nr:hypothetical protein [Actinomycetospora corticicola]